MSVEYKRGELNGKRISLYDGKGRLLGTGVVIDGNTTGLFVDEGDYEIRPLDNIAGPHKLYSHLELENLIITVHDEQAQS